MFTKRTQQTVCCKTGKPFTGGQLVRVSVSWTIAKGICPDKLSIFNTSSLLVARPTKYRNVAHQMNDVCRDFESFTICLNESTDVSDSAKIL